MDTQFNSEPEQIDQKTSRSICEAVAERLQQNFLPEPGLSPSLQKLVDELRQREQTTA
jgi:hypothetical protein